MSYVETKRRQGHFFFSFLFFFFFFFVVVVVVVVDTCIYTKDKFDCLYIFHHLFSSIMWNLDCADARIKEKVTGPIVNSI